MAEKLFLGSLGRAEAFKRNENGELELVFVSKTLTNSGVSISTTKDEIRAGEGAPVQFCFYHDPTLTVNMTDVVFNRKYIEVQMGTEFEDNATSYQTATATAGEDGSLSIEAEALALPLISCDDDSSAIYVWYAKAGTDDWAISKATVSSGKTTLEKTGTPKVDYCVRYLGADESAKAAEITSSIVPSELFLVITAPVFAGDACQASKTKGSVGTIQYEIPRFSLDGSLDFTMEMSSNQTMSLSGSGLATTSEDCSTGAGKLLRIIESIKGRKWYDGVTELIVDEDSAVEGKKPVIYSLNKEGKLSLVDNSKLMYRSSTTGAYTKMTEDYAFTSGTIYINIYTGALTSGSGYLAADEVVAI